MDKSIFTEVISDDQNKPWLIMIHGFTQNHKVFDRQVADFKDKFNIILIDLRGHGGSDHIHGPFGIEEYTDDLESIVNHYSLNKFYCWDTHTGTAISLVYTLRHPEHVLGLILEGTVLPGLGMPRVTELINRAKKISDEKGIEEAKKDWFDYADWFEYMREHNIACRAEDHWKIISEFKGDPWICKINSREVTNVEQRIDELKIPILMYNGEEDLDDFFKVARHLKNKKRDIQLEIIPDAGGFPCWENPHKVNSLVRNFFNQIC